METQVSEPNKFCKKWGTHRTEPNKWKGYYRVEGEASTS